MDLDREEEEGRSCWGVDFVIGDDAAVGKGELALGWLFRGNWGSVMKGRNQRAWCPAAVPSRDEHKGDPEGEKTERSYQEVILDERHHWSEHVCMRMILSRVDGLNPIVWLGHQGQDHRYSTHN